MYDRVVYDRAVFDRSVYDRTSRYILENVSVWKKNRLSQFMTEEDRTNQYMLEQTVYGKKKYVYDITS